VWSTDSSRFAITDWAGSSASEIFVGDAVSAKPSLMQSFGMERYLLKEELDGHIYYEALAWEDASALQVRVFGHTDEPAKPNHGFTYFFRIDFAAKSATLLRRTLREDSD